MCVVCVFFAEMDCVCVAVCVRGFLMCVCVCWFVGQEEARLHSQAARQANAQALATRKFPGFEQALVTQADQS